MIVAVPVLIAGLVLLVQGADKFVDGAAGIAVMRRLSPVLVGAVVIGFGTSAPEMVVSVIAAARDEVALGVGNVVGSNVANLTLVLGVAGLVGILTVDREILMREGPLATAAVAVFAAFIGDGEVERWEGIVLLVGLVVALFLVIRGGSGLDGLADPDELDQTAGQLALTTGLGLVMTVVGAQVVVWASTEIADELDLSGGFVGFTMVALGTSLPELGTTVAACRKGETALVVGNLLGSNIFNSLAVGGLIGVVGPGPINDDLLSGRGAVVMLASVLLAYLFAFNGRRISKLEGLSLLVVYAVAIGLLAGGAEEALATLQL